MDPNTGRVYHPAWPKVGNIGLVRSKLAIELSKFFHFSDSKELSPTHIWWQDSKIRLQSDWVASTQRFGLLSYNS